MSHRLIIARHGNTFRPEDEPVWVGARTDMPLVEKGLAQAQALGDALKAATVTLASIVTGPLQRTKKTAEIVAQTLALPESAILTDTRLTEIDYGTWEGKSTQAVIALGGEAELTAWNKHSLFPTTPGWSPSEAQIESNIRAIADASKNGTNLIVTSNGILRFFARLADNAADYPELKVSTGSVCVLTKDEGQNWRIAQWNQPPHMLKI